LSAGASIFGAQAGASAQENAAQTASNTQLSMFNQAKQLLSPYVAQGNAANTALTAQLPSLSAPVSMTEAQLQQTPGYQFNLNQGLESVQNSNAARGLGISGAALKGAASYATGLADATYQNQFNNAVTNKNLTYNMLAGQQSLGENAAAGVGNAGITVGNQIGQNTIGAGNAAAAADVASGNAVGSGANAALQGYTLNNLFSGSGGGGGYFNTAQAATPYTFGTI
jgi:hypothetical protein